MEDVKADKLPGLEALAQPGKKDGQTIMLRNGAVIEAYSVRILVFFFFVVVVATNAKINRSGRAASGSRSAR